MVDISGYTSNESSGKMPNLNLNDLPSDGDESFGSERSGSRRSENSDGAAFILVSGFPFVESESNVSSIHVPTGGDGEKIKGVAFIELCCGVNAYRITGCTLEFDRIHLKEAIVMWLDMHSFSEFDKFEPISYS